MHNVKHWTIWYHCQLLCHQHVALCPWFVETAIVDDQTKKLVLEKSPLKFTTVERVGEAFELAVKEQRLEEIKSIEGFSLETTYWMGNNDIYLKEQEIMKAWRLVLSMDPFIFRFRVGRFFNFFKFLFFSEI